jgi:hypothetical protein
MINETSTQWYHAVFSFSKTIWKETQIKKECAVQKREACFSSLTECMLVLTGLCLGYLLHVFTTANTRLLVTHACNLPFLHSTFLLDLCFFSDCFREWKHCMISLCGSLIYHFICCFKVVRFLTENLIFFF